MQQAMVNRNYLYENPIHARWAVFLDEIGVNYRYKSQPVFVDLKDDGGHWERPDFWLPYFNTWMIVTATEPNSDET